MDAIEIGRPLEDEQRKSELIRRMAVLLYCLFKHTGWVRRRVDKWSYMGDAQWRCAVSLDLDMGHLQAYFTREYLRGEQDCDDSRVSHRPFSEEEQLQWRTFPLVLPLGLAGKQYQFLSFDMRDREGKPLCLLPRAQSAEVCLSMLMGAVASEHGQKSKSPLPLLDSKDPLAAALHEWFNKVDLPQDEQGVVEMGSPDFVERIRRCFIGVLHKLAGERKMGEGETAQEVERFEFYYNRSPIFRYFVVNFAYKWLICTTFNGGDSSCSMVKYSYVSSRYVLSRKARPDGLRPTPLSLAGFQARFELDNIGFAESSHTSISAPEGLRFTPSFPDSSDGSLPRRAAEGITRIAKRKAPAPRYYLVDDVVFSEVDCNGDCKLNK